MDYPFFTKHLGSVSLPLLERLSIAALVSTRQHHPGFRQRVWVAYDIPSADIAEYKQLLPPGIQALECTEVAVLILPAGEEIKEHTDMAASGPYTWMWKTAHTHKIMLPLVTNSDCRSWHRRSRQAKLTETFLHAGQIYAYNDYVWHSGTNQGSTDRYMLALSFLDPNLEVTL